ncbi:MAG TPA: PAS domain-containing protein, partial [Planctomycetota bacterium]|nr:PAS domain-containing protein [Planctomycetota bacterium]
MPESAEIMSAPHASFLVHLDDATRPLESAEAITSTAAQLLGEYLQVNRCAYADVEPDENTFNLTGDYNRDVPSIIGRYWFVQFGNECLSAMRANVPFVIEDSDHDPRTASVREVYRQTHIRAAICVPMCRNGRLVAAMAVHAVSARAWAQDDIDLVVRVANRYWESIERARVGRELKGQWNLFDAALSHTPDFTYIFDRDGRFVYINPALLSLWQKSFQDAVGKNFYELDYPTDLADRLQRQIQEVITTRGKVRDQTPYPGADGATRYYEYIFVPIFADDGTVKAVAGSTRDITDRLQSEADLRLANDKLCRTNEELAQFTGIVSHDLQEPLRAVSNYMSLLEARASVELGDAARGYVHKALAATQRMQRMIRGLLDYARAGEHPPFQPVDLGRVVALAIENLTSRIEESHATIDGSVTASVLGDQMLLTQLFQNLLSNAVKFRS